MIKSIGLYSKMAGMSADAFFQRYEYGHVPLVQEIIGSSFAAYTRSYPVNEPDAAFEGLAPLGFDALTQIWHNSQAEVDETMARMARSENAARLAEDEAQLFDRKALLSFSVVERGTAPAISADRALHLVALYARPTGVDAGAFREEVEALAPRWVAQQGPDGRPLLAGCRRNHLIEGSVFHHPLYETPAARAPDLLLELWFWRPANLRRWLAAERANGDAPPLGVGLVAAFG